MFCFTVVRFVLFCFVLFFRLRSEKYHRRRGKNYLEKRFVVSLVVFFSNNIKQTQKHIHTTMNSFNINEFYKDLIRSLIKKELSPITRNENRSFEFPIPQEIFEELFGSFTSDTTPKRAADSHP